MAAEFGAGETLVRKITLADGVKRMVAEGATGAGSLDEFIGQLKAPRAVWLMVPAAVVDSALADLAGKLQKDDLVIDGGNSYYVDDIRRAKELAGKGIHYLDVGTSGGVFGLERGFSLMAGGEREGFNPPDAGSAAHWLPAGEPASARRAAKRQPDRPPEEGFPMVRTVRGRALRQDGA